MPKESKKLKNTTLLSLIKLKKILKKPHDYRPTWTQLESKLDQSSVSSHTTNQLFRMLDEQGELYVSS